MSFDPSQIQPPPTGAKLRMPPKNRVMKLRGREENGFGTAGFGCILVRGERGMVECGAASISQALL
jgi:hypothetical protein